MSARVYQRRFPHEEARERYLAGGVTLQELADEYGVTQTAIHRVVSDRARELQKIRYERAKTAGRCVRCGAAISLHSMRISGSRFCYPCAMDNQATSVGDGELRCVTCKKWKPDEDFPRCRGKTRRRGRHQCCRACCTVARQEYREASKVPCIGCGALVLPPEEKRTNGVSFPRCRTCANRGIEP